APGTRFNTMHWFSGSDGRNPNELAFGEDGSLYGTTHFGGKFLGGTVFKMGTNGDIATLVSFDQTNGALPLAGLVLGTNGDLYGSTSGGGANSTGTLFTISGNDVFRSLYSFRGDLDGGSPAAPLARGLHSAFYGSTLTGGAAGVGTLFQVTPDGTL